MTGALRRALPSLLIPLGLVACGLASSPWLRSYPASVLAIPLFAAVVVSMLLPVAAVGLGLRRLRWTAVVDVAGYVTVTTVIGLHAPFDVARLWSGLVSGPSQILSFALPLVSPRTLLVAPLTLCGIAGAVLGECLARSWHSVLPYATLLVTFGLAYAATVRGVTSDVAGRRYDTLLAACLLLTLLLMRAAQAWLEQDLDAEAAQPDGVLPLRGLGIGAALALVVALIAALVGQSDALSGPPATAARVPPLERGAPLNPLAFVAGLRPSAPHARGRRLFRMSVDHRTSNYVAIADVDYYDGDGWTFQRTFRPSGGDIPAEDDPGLRARGATVTQHYTIDAGPLTSAPWMPFLYRPQRVSGLSVDVDSASGMVVPTGSLHGGEQYTVHSRVADTTFAGLRASAPVATSTPPAYSAVPDAVASSMSPVVSAFEKETGVRASTPISFLQALVADLHTRYSLAGGRGTAVSSPAPSSSPSSAGRSPASSPTPSTTPPATPAAGRQAGGTGFANVLATILGTSRSGTPEQYATLVALIARQVGVPARVVSGFRLGGEGRSSIPRGSYRVTAGEAWTWVEIPIDGHGWVVLDPSPRSYSARRTASPSARPSASVTPTPTRTPNGLVTQSNGGHAVAPKSTVPGSHHSSAAQLVLVLVVLAAVLLLGLLAALLGRKQLRARRRRRVDDPRARLLGAWQEGLDVLTEAGLADLAAMTSTQVAAAAANRFGDEPAAQARQLGEQANAALFHPSAWIGPGEAEDAWRTQGALRRSVRARMTVRERTAAGLRYRRPARSRPPARDRRAH